MKIIVSNYKIGFNPLFYAPFITIWRLIFIFLFLSGVETIIYLKFNTEQLIKFEKIRLFFNFFTLGCIVWTLSPLLKIEYIGDEKNGNENKKN